MLQRVARVLVVLLAIVTLALVAVWVVTNTEFGRNRVRNSSGRGFSQCRVGSNTPWCTARAAFTRLATPAAGMV